MRQDFVNWLFFLSVWLGSVARSGEVWSGVPELEGQPREISWGAGVAATQCWQSLMK